MTASVQLQGLDEIMKKVKNLEDLKAVKVGLKAGADHLKNQARIYPPRRLGAHVEFVSDRQRKFFFWALKNGKIEVPYARGSSPGSEDLANRWSAKESNQGLTWTIGNNASYARLAQDEDKQTQMHKRTGWHTIQRIVDHEGPKVVRLIAEEVGRMLAK